MPPDYLRALGLLIATAVVSSLLAPSRAAADPFGPGSPEGAPKSDRIRADFFGVDIGIGTNGPASWPGFDLGGVRVAQPWSAVERSPGVYDCAHLDLKVAVVEQHHAKPVIVIEGTPASTLSARLNPHMALRRGCPLIGASCALVARYGKRADYQVWNESNIKGLLHRHPGAHDGDDGDPRTRIRRTRSQTSGPAKASTVDGRSPFPMMAGGRLRFKITFTSDAAYDGVTQGDNVTGWTKSLSGNITLTTDVNKGSFSTAKFDATASASGWSSQTLGDMRIP